MAMLDEQGMGGGEEGADREKTRKGKDETGQASGKYKDVNGNITEGKRAAYHEFTKAVSNNDHEAGVKHLESFVRLASMKDDEEARENDSEQDTDDEN